MAQGRAVARNIIPAIRSAAPPNDRPHPACEDSGIAERMRELQAERIAMLAGCNCPSSVRGEKIHVPSCPLRAPPPAALALAVAMERIRARRQRQEDKR